MNGQSDQDGEDPSDEKNRVGKYPIDGHAMKLKVYKVCKVKSLTTTLFYINIIDLF